MWVEKNGPTWRIRDEVAGRKVTLKAGYPNKTAAKAAMVLLRADELRGDALVPRGGETLLGDWIDMWWPVYEASLKPSSQRTEESRVRIHIRPQLGHLKLDDIGSLTVQRFVADLARGAAGRRKLAPKTIRNVHGVLHKVLDAAVQERLIRVNPASGSGLPPKRHKEMRFLTAPEIERLLAACPDLWHPLVLLLVTTGLRYGEAIGLKVGRLDVLAGVLRVEEAMHEAGRGDYIFTEPKSEKSRRAVTFPALQVGAELAALVVDKARDDLVFTGEDGKAVTRNFRTRIWASIRDAAGLPGLRIHDLRHTHAAVLISANVPLTAVQRRLGHSSIRVTSDMYGHLMPEVGQGLLDAVTAALPKINGRGGVGETTSPDLPIVTTSDR